MAILCLASDLEDLKKRLGNILVAYTYSGEPVYARDLKAVGAMTALLKDAINPNLVQTLEGNPALIHGGPFANIAHGCNSVRATKLALKLADYTITEAGFGSDLGAEKFFDIKCRCAGLKPDCTVLVATIRALKYNGGVAKPDLTKENVEALEKGIVNLGVHIDNLKKFGVPVVVAINHFYTDTEAEIAVVKKYCEDHGAKVAFSDVFLKGGDGDDETIKIDLSKVPQNISRITFAVTIYDAAVRNQNFGQVNNAFIRIYNPDTNEELLRYDLTEDFSIETALVIGELYRHGGEWKFNAVGAGYQGGLEALCRAFGVNV